ncbi:MAG TPA: cysteine desulfurase [Mariprofundaceae bacterium]|nr:cysteine desulfurase [Mariprofundaceae bacterium]
MSAAEIERGLDIAAVRDDFPILHQEVHGHPLVYLDNAATTQKPKCVIDTVQRYYTQENANVHRGVHHLSELSTKHYEGARDKVRRFINARSTREIVFVRGATEAINLVAQSYGRSHLKAGDEILITGMEHHSNIVPWQLLCEQTGTVLKVVPIDDEGKMDFAEFERLLSSRTRLVAMAHMSNALGTINPVKTVVEMAHAQGVPVLLDGAQATAHLQVDVQELDVDFYAISAHKMLGPTGIGVLYAKEALLEAMPPYQGGGDMISMVTFEKTHYNDLPYKFEAGTPHIAGVIGLGEAVDYLASVGLERIARHEHDLLAHATKRAEAFEGLTIIGTATHKASILSFVLKGVHPHDLGTILDRQGVAIRAGHHCAMPVMDRFGVPATARASFALYNTVEEVDRLFDALEYAQRMFA